MAPKKSFIDYLNEPDGDATELKAGLKEAIGIGAEFDADVQLVVDTAEQFGDVAGAVTATEAIRDETETIGQQKVDAAQAQAVIATDKATQTAADRVQTDADVAISSLLKTQAEAARDASTIAAGPVYLTEAAGLAATAVDGQFVLLSADGLTFQKRKKVDAGSSSLVASYPTQAGIKAVTDTLQTGYVLKVVSESALIGSAEIILASLFGDEAGNAPGAVLQDGTVVLAKSRLGAVAHRGVEDYGTDLQAISYPEGNYKFAFTDAAGNVAFGVTNEGVFLSGSGAVDSALATANTNNQNAAAIYRATATAALQQPTRDVNSIIVYGQSLSVGNETWPPLTRLQKFNNLMLGGAVYPNGSTNSFVQFAPSGLQPLVSKAVSGSTILTDAQVAALPAGDQTYGENPGVGMANDAAYRLSRRTLGAQKPFLVYAPGVGGRTIEQLSKVNNQDAQYHYGRFLSSVQQAHSAALAAGKTHAVTAIVWMQGEWDYRTDYGSTKATKLLYKAALAQLRNDMVADVKAATGQTEDPVFIMYQTGANYTYDADMNGLPGLHVGMAQLEYALENPSTVMIASPAYPVTDKGGHFDSNGSRQFGCYLAKTFERAVIEGRRFRPLSPTKIERLSSTKVRVHFHVPVGPLVFDAPYVVNTAQNYASRGFQVTDSGGAKSILSVDIVAPTIVDITLGSAVDAVTGYVWYAPRATVGGNGNLRDSDPDVASEIYEYLAGSGMYASANIPALVNKPYPLPNWCVAFYLPLGYSEG